MSLTSPVSLTSTQWNDDCGGTTIIEAAAPDSWNCSIDVVQRCVGQHVGVVGQEVLVAVEVLAHAAQPLADRRFESGVDEGDRPVADVGVHQFDLAVAHHEVVRRGFLVVRKKFLMCAAP